MYLFDGQIYWGSRGSVVTSTLDCLSRGHRSSKPIAVYYSIRIAVYCSIFTELKKKSTTIPWSNEPISGTLSIEHLSFDILITTLPPPPFFFLLSPRLKYLTSECIVLTLIFHFNITFFVLYVSST